MSSFAAKTVVTARENETSEALFRSLQRLDARARERKRRYP
jgi:hypothetical protein